MSGDKRSVSTDALETLGTIITPNAGRDAIHLAVEPAIAGQILDPGEDVGYLEDGRVGVCNKPLGIVDPFLKSKVRPGQMFWLVVYPRQITSLRHVWTHPSFPDKDKPEAKGFTKEESEAWLHNFLDNADCPGYDMVMQLVKEGSINEGYDPHTDSNRIHYIDGEYMFFFGMDAHGEIPSEFWVHAENVLGMKIPNARRASYFSCTC
jgi:hypothetical protein